ncbi:MAG: c-type cytochrome [Chloroflexi bacterium]|nr:c-type cytochrome [Chloroflexota bacterium]
MQNENYERYMWIGLGLTVLLIIALGFAWLTEPDRIAAAGKALNKISLTRGRELYVDNCTSCHGTRGEGGVGPALNNKALLANASDEVLVETIRAGRPNTTMPAWAQANGGPFTDEDVRYVVSFLRAWEPNAPVIATDFKPSASRGATLFASTCSLCHGEEGKGATALALNNSTRLKSLNDTWYRQTIANGRPAKGMPTWGTVLSPNQIEDLVALFGAWRTGERVLPDTTVADLLESALYSLDQRDAPDALFYLKRAKSGAFGPALAKFDPLIALIEKNPDQALKDLKTLRDEWPIGNATKGKKVYNDACAGCHGSEGQGGVGRKLKPNEFMQKSTNAEVLMLALNGRQGTAMRSFEGKLTEEQLADAIAFLRTWQK